MIIGRIKKKILADKKDDPQFTACQPRWHSDAYLTCRHSFNTKDYIWKLPNGKNHIRNSWRYSVIGRGTLRIRAVQQRHSGMYRKRVICSGFKICGIILNNLSLFFISAR